MQWDFMNDALEAKDWIAAHAMKRTRLSHLIAHTVNCLY
jgi:hypothetical protein